MRGAACGWMAALVGMACPCEAGFGEGEAGVAIIRIGESFERSNLDGSEPEVVQHCRVLAWLKAPHGVSEERLERRAIVNVSEVVCNPTWPTKRFGRGDGDCEGDVKLVAVHAVGRKLESWYGIELATAETFDPAIIEREKRGFEAVRRIRRATSEFDRVDRVLAALRQEDSEVLRAEVRRTWNRHGFPRDAAARLHVGALELAVCGDDSLPHRWWLWLDFPRWALHYEDHDPRRPRQFEGLLAKLVEGDPEWRLEYRRQAVRYARITIPALRRLMTTAEDVDEREERNLLRLAHDFVPFLGRDHPAAAELDGLRPLLLEHAQRRCDDEGVVRTIETIVERTWGP